MGISFPREKDKSSGQKASTVNWDEFRQHLDKMSDVPVEEALPEAVKAAPTVSDAPADAPTRNLHLLNVWAKRLRAL